MIKGVNRQMIEVTQTDSPFYERALFVVKPEYAGESYEALHREAIQVMERLGAPSAFRRRNKALFWGPAAGSRRFGGSGNRSSGGGAVACRITVCFCPKNGKDRHKKETLLIWIIGGALAALP